MAINWQRTGGIVMRFTLNRAALLVAGVALASAPAPTLAAPTRDEVLDVLLGCAKIPDLMARVGCYDTNIRTIAPDASTAPADRPVVPPPVSSPVIAPAKPRPQREAQAAQPAPRPAAAASQSGSVTAIVAAVAERGPGEYLVTLEDGSAWEFTDTMSQAYRPPQRASTVEIERGALGSYRLRYDRQQPVRVRRVR